MEDIRYGKGGLGNEIGIFHPEQSNTGSSFPGAPSLPGDPRLATDTALQPSPSLSAPAAKSTSLTHAKASNGEEGFDGTVYGEIFRFRHMQRREIERKVLTACVIEVDGNDDADFAVGTDGEGRVEVQTNNNFNVVILKRLFMSKDGLPMSTDGGANHSNNEEDLPLDVDLDMVELEEFETRFSQVRFETASYGCNLDNSVLDPTKKVPCKRGSMQTYVVGVVEIAGAFNRTCKEH
ncbi:hypothetical protein JHK85_024996 [Glycine max]|nr:hypothetical protein JHK85_024996 [Glycine max]